MTNYEETILEQRESPFHCFSEKYTKKRIRIKEYISEVETYSYSYPNCQFAYTQDFGYSKKEYSFGVTFHYKPSLEEIIDKYARFMWNLGRMAKGEKLDDANW